MVGALEFPAEPPVLDVHTLLVVTALICILVLNPNKSFIMWRKELTPKAGVSISHRLLYRRPDLVHCVDM